MAGGVGAERRWWTNGLRGWLAVVALGAVAGCATPTSSMVSSGMSEADKAETVRKRAAARWEALIKGDIDSAYAFLSPASRQLVSKEQVAAPVRRFKYREAAVQKVTCEAEACKVAVLLTYDHPKMPGMVAPLTETWVIENGQAWYVHLN